MRARRVRFTTPRVRSAPERVTKTRDGVTVYRQNAQGRHALRELLGEQRRKQQSLCANCNGFVELTNAKFRDKEFREGVENVVVHRKCPS